MADGGTSAMIMLVTGLLIAGGAGVLLIDQWEQATRNMQTNEQKRAEAENYDISFAGDPMMVSFDTNTGGSNEITFYVQNTGLSEMSTTYQVLINGNEPASTSESVVPSGSDWVPGSLLEVTVGDSSYSSLNDGDDILIFFIGQSERSPLGFQHVVTMDVEVRLNEL